MRAKKRKKVKTLVILLSILAILLILIPITLAWFTDSAFSSTELFFGEVAIEFDDEATVMEIESSERTIEKVIPGDKVKFEFEVYNAAAEDKIVDMYAMIKVNAIFKYNNSDITSLLTSQNYFSISDTCATLNPNFYNGGSSEDKIFCVLKENIKGNGVKLTGTMNFDISLPDEITDGINTYPMNNPSKEDTFTVSLDVCIAVIQKDNITIATAKEELTALLAPSESN